MSDRINSRIFGYVRRAARQEREQIRIYIETVPVDVFQELNSALNKRGLMLGIRLLNENATPGSESDKQDIMNEVGASGPVGADR